MEKLKLALLVCVGCLFIFGCQADPNESSIPDGKDFKDFDVNLAGDDVITDIYFYGTLTLTEFFYYYDTDSDDGADFLIKCRPTEFKVYKETGSGIYTDLKYSGVPALSGAHYHLEFPLSALELDGHHEFNIFYWFFAMDSGDRMPDSGKELLALVL